MNFAQPGLAAAALVAGALPIILHLLLRRARATAWPSNMLLQRALDQIRRRRRIDAWVLLALRSLGIAAVGWAMAGPFLGATGPGAGFRELWIVIDDGATSAERSDRGETGLESIRRSILKEIDALRDGDRVALVRASMPARIEIPPTADRSRVRAAVQSSTTRSTPSDLVAALEMTLPPDRESPGREVLLASTLRKGSLRADQRIPGGWSDRAKGVRWRSLRPPDSAPGNRWIDQVDASRAPTHAGDSTVGIRIGLARSGGGIVRDEIQARTITGEVLGQASPTWSEGSTQNRAEMSVRGLRGTAFLVQAPPDAQPLDDSVAVVDLATSTPQVTVIGRRSVQDGLDRMSASSWITRALEASGLPVREMDPSTLAVRPPIESDAVILCRPDLVDSAGWKWLGRFVRDGGLIITMPVPEVEQAWVGDAIRETGIDIQIARDPAPGQTTLRSRQPRTRILAALGAEVDELAAPVTILRHWTVSGGSAEPMLVMDSGSPALISMRSREGRGLLVLFAFPPELDSTDLPLRPLMVPLLQEIVRTGRALASDTDSLRSGMRGYLGPSAAGGLLRSGEGTRVATLEIGSDGFTVGPIPSPGLWRVEQRDGRSRWVAVRLDPESTSIEAVDVAEIEAWRSALGKWSWADESPTTQVDADTQASRWTLPLLFLALALLVTESLWSRRASPRPNPEPST